MDNICQHVTEIMSPCPDTYSEILRQGIAAVLSIGELSRYFNSIDQDLPKGTLRPVIYGMGYGAIVSTTSMYVAGCIVRYPGTMFGLCTTYYLYRKIRNFRSKAN